MSNTRKRYKKKQILRRFGYVQLKQACGGTNSCKAKQFQKIGEKTLECQETTAYICQPISPEAEVAAILCYLSDAGRMGKIANSFRIVKSTVSSIVKNVTEMKCQHLGPKFIKLPLSENEVKHLAYGFENVHGSKFMELM